MSFLSGATHILGNVATPVLETTGAAISPLTGANNQLTQAGHNISNQGVNLTNAGGLVTGNAPAFSGTNAYGQVGSQSGTPVPVKTSQVADNSSDPYAAAAGGTTTGTSIDPVALAVQQSNLNDLLGRTDTGLNQGLSALQNSYQSNLNTQQNAENQALQDYGDQRVSTNQDKLKAYDTASNNAHNGYNSLAQIIGRSSGSGSSAFQDLLPSVVGKDLSANRTAANDVYASNLGNIDTAQKKTEGSFQSILADLANQRAQQEQTLRTGAETQRQNLLGQQQQLAATGGNTAQVNALQGQIQNSRNAVDNFFSQFQPTVTAQQAAIAAPDLGQYNVDRANVNAQAADPTADPTNPYAQILRKQLQDQSAF